MSDLAPWNSDWVIPPRVTTPVQIGPLSDIVRLSAPAPCNSDWVIPPRVSRPVQIGPLSDKVRLSAPAPCNSDWVVPPRVILIEWSRHIVFRLSWYSFYLYREVAWFFCIEWSRHVHVGLIWQVWSSAPATWVPTKWSRHVDILKKVVPPDSNWPCIFNHSYILQEFITVQVGGKDLVLSFQWLMYVGRNVYSIELLPIQEELCSTNKPYDICPNKAAW